MSLKLNEKKHRHDWGTDRPRRVATIESTRKGTRSHAAEDIAEAQAGEAKDRLKQLILGY